MVLLCSITTLTLGRGEPYGVNTELIRLAISSVDGNRCNSVFRWYLNIKSTDGINVLSQLVAEAGLCWQKKLNRPT